MNNIEINNSLSQGNPDAFSVIYKELHPRMRSYCRLFIKEADQIEDIVQDCFVHLWDKRGNIDVQKSIESYLFVILRNKCLKVLKDQQLLKNEIPIEELPIQELQFLYQLDFLEKKEKPLEERLIVSLKKAIDELPPKRKKVFIKSKIEGMKQIDIAEEMGVSVKVIEKHISQAKKQLRKKLLKEYAMLTAVIAMILQ
ncbi:MULTISPECIES: RNA polymerase sigma-70 factor [unclassified Saccharicrinis]|uniref:RNA polymerase sigma-70 factor n=1 Tax=unclassified Saccharicrinis TaxID=2646859 RepID=UPI003D32F6D6